MTEQGKSIKERVKEDLLIPVPVVHKSKKRVRVDDSTTRQGSMVMCTGKSRNHDKPVTSRFTTTVYKDK